MVAELRIDPDDQKPYTLEALEEKYAGDFTKAEIVDYWREECAVVPSGEHFNEYGGQRDEAGGPGAVKATNGEPQRMERPEPSRLEKKIDPEDGLSYYFEDFMEKNKGHFEKADIIDYWFDEMRVDLPDGTKLFVSNLSKETTEERLSERFATYGEIASCKVYRDLGEVSKGFATVQYMSIEAAKRAVVAMNGVELGGVKLAVTELLDHDRNLSAFVGAIPKEVTAEELEEAFGVCGEVAQCSVFRDPSSDDPRGQARVDFIFPDSVQRVVDMFHLKAAFGGQRLIVTPWREDDCGRRVLGPSVFVAKLPLDTTAQQLRELFDSVGVVAVNVTIFRNKETLESRGIGKVELGDDGSVKTVLEKLHGADFEGSSIVVREFSQAKQVDRQQLIFVSGLSPETTSDGLRRFFGEAVEVVSTFHYPEREPGRSAAKVSFKDSEGFKKALRLNGAELDGRTLFVREYLPMHQVETQRPQRVPPMGAGFPVHVSNLSRETTVESLREHLGSCGQIVDAYLLRNKDTGVFHGTAKVTFVTQEGMQHAINEMSGTELDGRMIMMREFLATNPGGRGGDNIERNGGVQQEKGPGIFVAGLSPETTEEALRQCFSDFGQVTDAIVLRSRGTGLSRGIGRVFFADRSARRRVFEHPQQVELDGHKLVVRPHGPKTRTFPVFVSGLPYTTTAQMLQGHFESEFGEVTYVNLLLDREGKPRGLAKLDFATAEVQQLALSRQQVVLDGRIVHVKEFCGANSTKAGFEGFGVHVSGLSPETIADSLQGLFRKCGEIRDCRIDASRQTAKVDFATDEARRQAMRELQGVELDGRAISLREAVSSGPLQFAEAEAPSLRVPGYAVFVGGLCPDTTEDVLREHCGQCGEVSNYRFIPSKDGQRFRKAAYVEFRTKQDQEMAIKELHGSVLDSRTILVRAFTQASSAGEALGPTALVMGLPQDVTNDQLSAHFQRALGSTGACVRNVRIMRDRETGSSKGLAKVELTTQEVLKKAVEVLDDSEFDGKRISVRALLSEADKDAQRSADAEAAESAVPFRDAGVQGRAVANAGVPTTARHAIFVSGLCWDTSVESLRRHLEDAGRIRDIRLIMDRNTGRPKGTAFVEFEDKDSQRLAIAEWDKTELDGSTISVREFEPRPSTSASSRSVPFTPPPRAREADTPDVGRLGSSPPVGSSPSQTVQVGARVQTIAGSADEPERRAADEPERRVDPDDGKAYTFEELRARAKGDGFSDQEILEYWRFDCEPVKPPAAPPKPSQVRSGPISTAPSQTSEVGVGKSLAPEAEREADKKVDPEDGKEYTYQELHRRATEEGFTDQEILEYWQEECVPVKRSAPTPASAPPAPAAVAPAPAPADPGRPAGRSVEAEAPHVLEAPRVGGVPVANRSAAVASPSSSACGLGLLKDMSLKDWLDAMDSQWLRAPPANSRPTNGIRDYLGVLEEQFDSLEQIIARYLRRGGGPNGTNVLDDGFFEDVGISKIGQRRVVNKWVAANI